MSSEILYLDTDHGRYVGGSPSDVVFELNFNTAYDSSGYSLAVEEISVPNQVYPITSNNNSVYFQENGGGTLTATLTPNRYTITQIAAALQTELNLVGSLTYAVASDSQSNKITVSVILPDFFEFVYGINNLYAALGFQVPTGQLATYTSTWPVYLAGSQYIDLVFNLSTHTYSSNGVRNIFDRIPLLAPFGNMVYHHPHPDTAMRINDSKLTFLEMRLLDDQGKPWILPPNAKVAIKLKLVPGE